MRKPLSYIGAICHHAYRSFNSRTDGLNRHLFVIPDLIRDNKRQGRVIPDQVRDDGTEGWRRTTLIDTKDTDLARLTVSLVSLSANITRKCWIYP